ncbi:hypothetical protein AWZ03_000945 [Drosophila navojoa]|uniref:Uncharacterized protein n=1 Tax=Drosophila navojoa TaxID=7232 RepID=A0A484BXI2_DRONA|nr:hypothetical protein AWZ03_000945 [Drosophila navojoa]
MTLSVMNCPDPYFKWVDLGYLSFLDPGNKKATTPMNQKADSLDSAATVKNSSSSSSSSSSRSCSRREDSHPGAIGQVIAIKLGHSYAARADLNYCRAE